MLFIITFTAAHPHGPPRRVIILALGHNRITREVIDQIVKNQLIQSSTLVKVQYKHFNDYNLFAVCTRGCLFHINRFNIIVAVFWNIFITNEMIEMRIV